MPLLTQVATFARVIAPDMPGFGGAERRIETLSGVGHWAWLEQPEKVAKFVVPFLREQVGELDRTQ
ncbi:hypothetical protein [Nocardia sp. NPDC004604]|uniref:alpha/beta fold hydrolase n=1 Tax=Nocardia sp. NPDC004604 TaxID=3157013 RepID=UPI0033AAC33D